MKKLSMLCLLITCVVMFQVHSAYAMRIPVDISAGYGTTYGGLGCKLTLAQMLFGGVGTFDGKTMGSVGVQIPIKFSDDKKYEDTFYVGASYGGIGVQETTVTTWSGTETDKKVILGYSGFAGYVWGWDSGVFIHVDLGISRGKVTWFEDTANEEDETITLAAIDFGVGYRFF